jgi:hypothetical protein
MVTVNAPVIVAVQERVEVPEPETLVGNRAHDKPAAGLVVAVRLTTPLNPLTAVMVMAEVPAWLTLTETLVGLATIAKSRTVKTTLAA